MDNPDTPVVVGADGTPDSDAAVRWAAQEAGRRAVPLLLAHAADGRARAAVASDPALAVESARSDGRRALADAEALARSVAPDARIVAVQRDDAPQHLLLELTEGAGLLVLGRRPAAFGHLLGRTTRSLGNHARCPLVVVPPGAAPDVGRPVVVGISTTPVGLDALRVALLEARLRRVELVAVRAWGEVEQRAGRHDVADVVGGGRSGARAAVRYALDTVRPAFPDVQVRVSCPGHDGPTALLEAAREADLLVVGAHGWARPRTTGAVAVLLRQSACAVAVVRTADPALRGLLPLHRPVPRPASLEPVRVLT